jgi:UDP-glucose 4-epimerase
MDNLENARESDQVRFIRGDVKDSLSHYLTENKLGDGPPINAIFHLAARVDVTTSMKETIEDAMVNYLGTINVLEYALRSGIRKMIFTSSAAVYGDTDELPVSEVAAPDPMSPYGINKLSSERIMGIYTNNYGIKCTSMRLFNVFGPRQRPDSDYAGVISKFVDFARAGKPLIIYGDGNQTRDFIYVKDVADALYRVYAGNISGTFNVGSGLETSINDLAESIEKISGRELKRIFMDARPGEIRRSRASVEKLEIESGFRAETSLIEGIRQMMRG